MNDKPRLLNFSGESPWFQLLVTVLTILGVGSVVMLLLTLAGTAISGSELSVFNGSTTLFSDKDVSFLRYMLIVQDISLLIIPSLIILKLSDNERGIKSAGLRIPSLKDTSLIIILAFCMFPVTSFTGEINAAVHLPSWLSGIEKWMIEKEQTADNLIDSLISSERFWVMLLNLLTIAVLPAIAEELIFRGVLQKIFSKLFRSDHFGIWFTAFVFSTVHFQFFGFVPRFILGLTFGYLYFWSSTIWVPVTAHFINNAFPVIMTYAHGTVFLAEPTGIPLWKQAIVLPVPLAVIILIMLYFRNQKIERLKSINNGISTSGG